MELIPKNSILEFRPDTVTNLRKQYNLDKPGETDKAVDVLEAWIKMQHHFVIKEFPRAYLEKTIIFNKGSIERAKTKLDKLCTYKTIMPECFGQNVTKNNYQDINEYVSALLPKLTEDNYRVFILKITAKTVTASHQLSYYRLLALIWEYIMAYEYCNGLILLIDLTETNIIELVKTFAVTLTEARKITTIVTEGFSMRIKGIHMVTPSKTVEMLVSILKQIFTAKIGNRICAHKDLSTVYQYISKEILPSDFGGKERPLLNLRNDLMDIITEEDFRKYIDKMSSAKTDESRRHTQKFDEKYMGMPGSFRTLHVD